MSAERVILHVDMNNFYASVECLHNPSIRGMPVVVGGDAELRHGIVLAKNYIAKQYGIKTGDVIWEAREKCRDLVVVPANFQLYLRFSKMARKIYERYTDMIEAFGIDECWLDVTGSVKNFGSGQKIADEIREAIKFELGCTASVGVSWNKIFAKLGSDMKKPDATTVISKENYKTTVFNLPAEDLLYVGQATKLKLKKYNINTIGDIARTDVDRLKGWLGKWGEYLWIFANGYDQTQVSANGAESIIKSVGNSTTTPRDLETPIDVKMIITVMAESVAARLREQWLKGQVVSLYLRSSDLEGWGKQVKIPTSTFISSDIIKTAMGLFEGYYSFSKPIRSVGVKLSDLSSADTPRQTIIFESEEQKIKAEKLEMTIDSIRTRFGHNSIMRGTVCLDPALINLDPKSQHTIHPYNYFK